MKRHLSVLSLLMAGFVMAGAPGIVRADDLKISGFGAIDLDLTDEANDNTCSNPAGAAGTTNCDELQFNVPYAEVDFEKKVGAVTVRLDLDFNGASSNNIGGDDVEQMRFDWMLPVGQELGLTLTGGIFNSPVGFEAQDSPDKLQVSNGQLFDLVPSNLAGVQLAGGTDMVGGSIIFANDWRDPAPFATNAPTATPPVNSVGEEHTVGATLTVTPMPEVGLAVGYLDSGILPMEGLIDVVISGTIMPTPDLSLLYALEYAADEINTGTGITLHAKHGKHGLTVRYDMVEVDAGGGAPTIEPTSLTVAFLCSLEENLKLKLEWRDNDPDTGASSTDAATLQFVALF